MKKQWMSAAAVAGLIAGLIVPVPAGAASAPAAAAAEAPAGAPGTMTRRGEGDDSLDKILDQVNQAIEEGGDLTDIVANVEGIEDLQTAAGEVAQAGLDIIDGDMKMAFGEDGLVAGFFKEGGAGASIVRDNEALEPYFGTDGVLLKLFKESSDLDDFFDRLKESISDSNSDLRKELQKSGVVNEDGTILYEKLDSLVGDTLSELGLDLNADSVISIIKKYLGE